MIGVIEDANITRLATLNEAGVLGYHLRQIKTYGGELRSQADRAKIKDFPAVWLAFDRADPIQETNTYVKMRGRWSWLVGTESLRNERAARHGAAGDVGAYQIAVDLIGIFSGRQLDVEGTEKIQAMIIEPVSVDDSRNGRLAVYAVPFTCNFLVKKSTPDVPESGPDAHPLEKIHTNWDLPPNGEVGPDLPDDDNANATSHVTGD